MLFSFECKKIDALHYYNIIFNKFKFIFLFSLSLISNEREIYLQLFYKVGRVHSLLFFALFKFMIKR